MNTLLLQPTDVLFFRDGRPMNGALPGHGGAWPLPSVINSAFHAALHRADLQGVHAHPHAAQRASKDHERVFRFGSFLSAGPFPVKQSAPQQATWYFPRPLDLQDSTLKPALLPVNDGTSQWGSLPIPLQYSTANRLPPSKDQKPKQWLSAASYQAYLQGSTLEADGMNDSDFSDSEANIGIAIDPDTQTTGQGQTEGQIYTAHYLRLRDSWRLGVFASAFDKINGDSANKRDLVKQLFEQPNRIVVGGQQRICTTEILNATPLPMPLGLSSGFNKTQRDGVERYLLKWILLSPAIWPEIPSHSQSGQSMNPHPGGWLPNWIFLSWDSEKRQCLPPPDNNGMVLLKQRFGKIRRYIENGKAKRTAEKEEAIHARLVAAVVPKPLAVTGWALPTHSGDGGAKSTHLAVPAGSVYYFEAESLEDVVRLAAVLNWHGTSNGTEIQNRRSTLMGEKGFGLGVCGTWDTYHS